MNRCRIYEADCGERKVWFLYRNNHIYTFLTNWLSFSGETEHTSTNTDNKCKATTWKRSALRHRRVSRSPPPQFVMQLPWNYMLPLMSFLPVKRHLAGGWATVSYIMKMQMVESKETLAFQALPFEHLYMLLFACFQAVLFHNPVTLISTKVLAVLAVPKRNARCLIL